MGIQDRDYYREHHSFLDRVGQQGATVWLIAITVGIFFGQTLTTVPGVRGGEPNPILRSLLVSVGAFDVDRIADGEVWRLVTPVFLHAGLWHLFGNMLVLYFTGIRLEQRYGSREFILLYLAAGIFASLVYFGMQMAGNASPARAVGASGAVFGVLVVYAFHYPRQQVLLFFVIPMPVWLLASMWVALDMFSAAGEMANPNGARSQIAHFAHLGSALFGFLYYQSGWEFRRLFARRPASSDRLRLRIAPPPDEDVSEPVGAAVETAPRPREKEAADEQLEAKLDAVLAKVTKYGQESLTVEEREILFRASDLYKKRRK